MSEAITMAGVPAAPTAIREAGPWPRYWARILDLNLFGLGVAMTLEALAFVMGAGLATPIEQVLFVVATTVLTFVCEAACLALVGTTPGKAVAGLRIETEDGRPLTLGRAARRTLSLFVRGLGCGIPPISVVTMLAAFVSVRKGRRAGWDRRAMTRVMRPNGGAGRTWLTFLLAVALCVLVNVLTAAAGAMADAATASGEEAEEQVEDEAPPRLIKLRALSPLPALERGRFIAG